MTRVKMDFVSTVAHELRTPLAQIQMFTETLLLGRVRSDIERRRALEIIQQEAKRLSDFVENILVCSTSGTGRRGRLTPQPTMLAMELQTAVESFAPLCHARGMEIRMEIQDHVTVRVDRTALRQILVNLIDNALKYGPPGQRVTVGAARFGKGTRLWVDDDGPGIPAAERERVFKWFYRMQRDIVSIIGGSGIGLAVVRELAKMHAATVWVETAPDGGARFIVEFSNTCVPQFEQRPATY